MNSSKTNLETQPGITKNADHPPANSTTPRDHCQARRTGFGDYVVCLEPPPHDCGYALHLGDEYLCLHPHHLDFAVQTEAGAES